MQTFRNDVFEPDEVFTLEEASGDIGGKAILGRIRGTFFVPNGKSRNNRYYSRSLWEKTLKSESVQVKLKDRRMLGTISHEQEIDDKALLEGKISHIVTDLRINEHGHGVGEAVILDTPAGRILNTLQRAGSKIFVSSRAQGKFSGDQDGTPKVDENSYELKTFDFVMDPGFLDAHPRLVEKFDEIMKTVETKEEPKKTKGDFEMETAKMLENVTAENIRLKDDITESGKQVEDLKGKHAVLESKVKELEESAKNTVELEEQVKAYADLGSPELISEALDRAKEAAVELNRIREELGEPEKISEALDLAQEEIKTWREVGGSPDKVEEALDKAQDALDRYKELGTPEQIEEAFDKIQDRVSTIKEDEQSKVVEKLAKDLGVSVDKIEPLVGTMSEEEITKYIKSLTEGVKNKTKYRMDGNKSMNEGGSEKKDEEETKPSFFNRDRKKSLIESLTN